MESFRSHCEQTGPLEVRRSLYGYDMPHGHEPEFISVYERHNAAVKEFFRDRPHKLLTVCWESGDGWKMTLIPDQSIIVFDRA